MFAWIGRLRRRPAAHEPEVEESKAEQGRKFDAWEVAKSEVDRVQKLAERRHADIHRPQHR